VNGEDFFYAAFYARRAANLIPLLANQLIRLGGLPKKAETEGMKKEIYPLIQPFRDKERLLIRRCRFFQGASKVTPVKLTCMTQPKFRQITPVSRISYEKLFRNLAMVFFLSALYSDAQVVNYTWTGRGATDLMSDPMNWESKDSPNNKPSAGQIIFGPLDKGAHQSVGVDNIDNLGPIVFSKGAPPMNLFSVEPNNGRIQMAHLNEPVRLANHSGSTQTIQSQLHVFWNKDEPISIRRWEATSGDFDFQGLVVLRGCGPNPSIPEMIWELAATGNMNFKSGVLDADSWPEGGKLRLIKSGAGRVTFLGETRWKGSAMVEQGVLAPEARWEMTEDLEIGPAASLEGRGQIEAPTKVRGKLAPGSEAIATLTFTKGLELSGTTEIGLDPKNRSSDLVSVTSGPLTYGGTLRVTPNDKSAKFTSGQVFQIFEWQEKENAPKGSFTKVDLPTLPIGMRWKDQLAKDGKIVVGP
jgi:hypothetical protein